MPARTCAFCPQKATTREHAWSDWLNPILGEKNRYLIEDSTLGVYRKHRSVGLHQKLPVLCDSCNNVWGSGIEDRMRAVVSPMVLGNQASLTVQDRGIIAIWTQLKAMICDYAVQQEKLHHYTCDERFLFRENSTVLPGTHMWFARSIGLHGVFKGNYGTRSDAFGRKVRVFAFTVSLGELILQLGCAKWSKKSRRKHYEAPGLDQGIIANVYSTRFYPSASDYVEWPPRQYLQDHDLNRLVDRWSVEGSTY